MSIFAVDKDGNRKQIAGVGLPGPVGKSAYQYAVEGGFTGTEAEFRALLGVRSNINLLHNSRWDRPKNIINQRNQNAYNITGINQYFIDRWIGTYISAVLEEDGLLITSDRSPTFSMYQRVENPQAFAGKTVTFSLLCSEASSVTMAIRGDIGNGSTNVGGKNLAVDTPGLHTITCVLPENLVILAPGFLVRAGGRIKPIAAKLELGSVQTLAHKEGDTWVLNDPPPDLALELAKCQRYLQVLLYGGYDEAYLGIGGISIADNKPKISIPFQLKQPMRANPTLITGYMQVNKARIVGRSLSTYLPDWGAAVESMSVYTSTKNQILVACKLPDTVTLAANYTYELDALSCPRGEVLLASAEL